jgi:hypothetical protein
MLAIALSNERIEQPTPEVALTRMKHVWWASAQVDLRRLMTAAKLEARVLAVALAHRLALRSRALGFLVKDQGILRSRHVSIRYHEVLAKRGEHEVRQIRSLRKWLQRADCAPCASSP